MARPLVGGSVSVASARAADGFGGAAGDHAVYAAGEQVGVELSGLHHVGAAQPHPHFPALVRAPGPPCRGVTTSSPEKVKGTCRTVYRGSRSCPARYQPTSSVSPGVVATDGASPPNASSTTSLKQATITESSRPKLGDLGREHLGGGDAGGWVLVAVGGPAAA